jgi:uracil-DNA glycosylase
VSVEPTESGEAWGELAGQVTACTDCVDLAAASRRRIVVGQAPAGAELLLLTEASGVAEEDAVRPLAGRSGHHLEQEFRCVAELLPRLRARRATSGAPC